MMGRRRVSFKVAPGVRISASSRGVRTSVGNNKARVSFGGGRTYTSAKVAGVRVSQNSYSSGRTSSRISVGGVSVGSPAAPRRSTPARPSLAQLERAAQADEIQQIEQALTSQHLEAFPAAAPEEVDAPHPVALEPLVKSHQAAATQRIKFYRFAERRQARERARLEAAAQAAEIDAGNQEIYRDRLQQAAASWQQLIGHDPASVIEAIDGAFADNASESTCVDAGLDDEGQRYATVVVVFGSTEMVPEKITALTPTGKTALKKRTKTDRNSVYLAALASTVLATVREALQTSPSTDQVRVAVLRRATQLAGTGGQITPIYAATFPRTMIDRIDLRQVNLPSFLEQPTDARLVRKGVTAEVVAIDTSEDPDLASLAEDFSRALSAAPSDGPNG